jgi:hypothetical protein
MVGGSRVWAGMRSIQDGAPVLRRRAGEAAGSGRPDYTAIAARPQWSAHAEPRTATIEETVMSKGMDQKKQQKKQPAKTLKEKREAKKEKKGK